MSLQARSHACMHTCNACTQRLLLRQLNSSLLLGIAVARAPLLQTKTIRHKQPAFTTCDPNRASVDDRHPIIFFLQVLCDTDTSARKKTNSCDDFVFNNFTQPSQPSPPPCSFHRTIMITRTHSRTTRGAVGPVDAGQAHGSDVSACGERVLKPRHARRHADRDSVCGAPSLTWTVILRLQVVKCTVSCQEVKPARTPSLPLNYGFSAALSPHFSTLTKISLTQPNKCLGNYCPKLPLTKGVVIQYYIIVVIIVSSQ
jgi:hypothetical protein